VVKLSKGTEVSFAVAELNCGQLSKGTEVSFAVAVFL
jgi:hypothetical protein